MIIRLMNEDDIPAIVNIWKQFYESEFSIEEFNSGNYKNIFVVEEDGKIIIAGGVRMIPEAVMVTNKNENFHVRIEALYKMLDALTFVAGRDSKQLHAFVQDEVWKKFLLKQGFQSTKGTPLYLNL